MSCPLWLKCNAEQLTLTLKVKPGAKQNKIALDATGGLQISLQAVAEDGKANKLLIQYLAKILGIPQKQISILRGTTSRNKVLQIKAAAISQEELLKCLMQLTINR
ncbi:DUF167 domain-containing protein [Legionella brunensis]|uniref:UPF0235 protein Lbru_2898 n=1 Tax=Legionella brunensis TaxID=29422 RepID=A0A0W0RZW6_9GAMM|nr:DUF167 domain-containing protein [Legionella brunensis]KTC76791.1 hypothetical protein Lbru_2898 [Legionella brunensis]